MGYQSRLAKPVKSSEISGFDPEFWPGHENDRQPKVIPHRPSSMRRAVLQTVLYAGTNTDFRESEEFLARMGEEPQEYKPVYRRLP